MSQTVLLIQDDPACAQAVLEALSDAADGPIQVKWVRNCADGLNYLAAEIAAGEKTPQSTAAILIELFLPDSQGIQTFERIFQAAPQIPLLVLSDLRDEETARLAVQRGAQDYLLKIRMDGYLLSKALVTMLKRAAIAATLFEEKARAQVTLNSIGDAVLTTDIRNDVTQARAASLKMSYLAQHDSLTDLPNRLLLKDRMAQSLVLAHRNQKNLAVLSVDLDHFNHVNDALGHVIGDRLLQSVARRLTGSVRASDTVSRQGGDDFVILLSEVAHAKDAAVIAEKILTELRAPHQIEGHDLFMTASIGVVTYPADGASTEELLQNADSSMYHAKDNGRNGYEFYRPEMNTRAVERRSVEEDLRLALLRNEFVLHYQPRINLTTGAITGVEALIRWHHPQRGLLLPAQFIPIAEESGLIVSIGRWVLREACRQARVWQYEDLPSIRVAVNVSMVELREKDYPEAVAAVLSETGVEPGNLELELTETFLVQDSKLTAEVLRSLKSIGVMIALDDFGTGYSSLSHLKDFSIDTLKIDRSFVHDLTTDPDDASIVSAMINMGESLHMSVVAEGVETREQAALLHKRHCPEVQGYYFSRAVDAADLPELLRRNPQNNIFD